MFGIEAIQIYFPKTYIDQTQFQQYNGVSKGKYTKGLGQHKLSFVTASQDVNSMSLTVVRNLMRNYNIHPSQVGRLEVGTQTLVDKSKSTKTVLMSLFEGYHDIEGATSINACYGGTNALINTLNWISSPFWDGRFGIVVAADIAVYENGPARCTGGAGAIAILIGPNGRITFDKQRSTFVDNVYDFYKPIPSSQYPIVDGKLSIDCYLKAVTECYLKLKQKNRCRYSLQNIDYFCFHCPFYKMVQKAYSHLTKIQNQLSEQQMFESFMKKVHPTLKISQQVGNIYTGSLFSCLISLLISTPSIKNKRTLLFSYGSGLCSTMLIANIKENPLNQNLIGNILTRLQNRIKINCADYSKIMLDQQKNYGVFKGKIPLNEKLIQDDTFYLSEIDNNYRRKYQVKTSLKLEVGRSTISSMQRLQNLNKSITNQQQKFYKLSVEDRINLINSKSNKQFDRELLQSGGLSLPSADNMIENVIGKLSLPLAVVPQLVINNKKYMVPMCIQEPSVVAACSSIGKLLSPYSFFTSSTPNIMLGQVHLPNCQPGDVHRILANKTNIVQQLNKSCQNMVKRGGGVTDLKVRQLQKQRSYSVDIFVNVCDAMGANLINSICQRAKDYVSKMGISTGIAILSNYCIERKSLSYFQMPIKNMGWKGVPGIQVAQKIIQAYTFAKNDKFRATTHNKGIMNGIDSVCLATGQDWRAIQSTAHSYASRGSKYQPLTHYEIIQKNGDKIFKGSLQLPISVGTVGGVLQRNPIYKMALQIMESPSTKQLAQIIVTVGLAQNFAALRALAIEGINKGHMLLHARTIAAQAGVPKYMIDEACKYMAFKKAYNIQTAKQFLAIQSIPKL